MTYQLKRKTHPNHASRPGATGTRSQPVDRAHKLELFKQLAETHHGPARVRLRNELIEQLLPLASEVAAMFRGRGEALEDIEQVARVGLIQSVDRYEPHRGTEFNTFAIPTMLGAIKRHFRDTHWAVRVPRRLQEIHLALVPADQELGQKYRRAPTIAELAEYVQLSEEDVLEGLEVGNALNVWSLDRPVDTEDSDTGSDFGGTLGTHDDGFEGVENQQSLAPLIAQLSDRDKRILSWLFYENLTQQQIADRLGVSQMQVSRLLKGILLHLRHGMLADDPGNPQHPHDRNSDDGDAPGLAKPVDAAVTP